MRRFYTKNMKIFVAILASILVPVASYAGDLNLTVRDTAGKPVRDAVISVYPAAGLPSGPILFPWPYVMAQQNIQFDPQVLIVPVGAEVAFPNRDKVRHHVYSFSPQNKFELKLYGREAAPNVTFKTVGAAAIGCNIHDVMVAFVRVVDTPYALKTDGNGVASIRGLPGGAARVLVWHPSLKGVKNEMTVQATIPASGAVALASAIELRGTTIPR
jgi:hypothetical protein